MDAAGYPHMQGGASSSSSSCRGADAAGWDAVQQQKRQRCQGSSSNDQVGFNTENNSLEASEPELQNFDYGENEEEDSYLYDEDEVCYDDENEASDYEFDDTDFNQQLADKFDDLDLPPGVEATVPWLQKVVTDDGPGDFKSMSEIEDEITKKYKSFKPFDTVGDFSDHHYANKYVGKTGREWTKRIQHDWKLLEKDLPGSIFVRVSENRMDLLRAVMIGPQGTPYHDGLFFFDAQFPASYPATPPVVYYHSGGLRLNPNLYACGKVCLSLLGTWDGQGCERWNSAHSTMLQHFEDLVAGHFRDRGRPILAACKYYIEGHKVGSAVPDKDDESKELESTAAEGSSSSSAAKPQLRAGRTASFKTNMEVLFEELLMEFNVKGADTKRFLAEKVKKSQPAAA